MARVLSTVLHLRARGRRGLAIPLAVGLGLLPLLALAIVLSPGVAAASGAVNPCNEANLTTALAGGGLVTFNCGPGPVTITLTSQKVIMQPTIVDGGSLGQVILSGGNITRAFDVKSSLTLRNLTIRNGAAAAPGGGAVFVENGGGLVLTNTLFFSNTTTNSGGAIYGDSGSALVIADSTFRNNQARDGGAISSQEKLSLTRSSLYSNLATESAGGLVSGAAATVTQVSIYSNTVLGPDGWGGGLDDEGTGGMTLDHAQIYGNKVISGNTDYGGGGLTVFYGALTVTNSSVYSNVVDFGPGGGIHLSYGATLVVSASAIYGNQALAGQGGGIDARRTLSYALTNLKINNSTVTGNSAVSGGGVSADGQTYPNILYSTLAGNNAAAGKQITGTIVAGSTIFAGGGDANCGAGIKSVGYNLDDANSCELFAIGDLTDTNPLLGPLAFNGGPTPTRGLLTGSPAIDTANPVGCPATDQRGAVRPVDGDSVAGAVCDIGAFEFKPLLYIFLPLLRR